MTVSSINPASKALNYLEKRIIDDSYRGNASSQHNRYSLNQIITILRLLDQHTPTDKLMTIRDTDMSKRPHNTLEETAYAEFCHQAKMQSGIGTQDAMRKNIFVDLHRMGFVERYDLQKQPTDPYSRNKIKYVRTTKLGKKLANIPNKLNQYFIYSKGIDKLLAGFIDIILTILRTNEYYIDHLTTHECMFFVSAVGTSTSFNLTINQVVELIKDYRALTHIQRRAVIDLLKQELKPIKYKGSKTQKRDFHNWKNKIDQIFYLLNQTVYFEVTNNQLRLSSDNQSNDNEFARRLRRSQASKNQYFSNHSVNKKLGFELHHVVPLAWSESPQHFKLLDQWQNMLYLDAFTHSKLSQTKNKHIILSFHNNNAILSSYQQKKLDIKYLENILYNPQLQPKLQHYNNDLINIENTETTS